MEDMDFGWTSIDRITTTSSDMSTETSVDAAVQTSVDAAVQTPIDVALQTSIDESTETSIDDTPPEAGMFSLTNHANEEVVLGETKGQLSNAISQIINEQGTAIPVKINSISNIDKETKFPLQG